MIVATPGRFAPGITSTGATFPYRPPKQSRCSHEWIWSVRTGGLTLCYRCGATRLTVSHDDGKVVGMAPTAVDYGHDPSDRHGNVLASEGCDRCVCGCKYWERDRCADCGGAWHPDYALDTESSVG